MRHIIFRYILLFTLLIISCFPSNAQDMWIKKATFQGWYECRFTHSDFVFKHDGKAYIGSGTGIGDYKRVYQYDPVTDTWSDYDTVPSFGNDGGYFSHNGFGYYIHDTKYYSQAFWKYHIAAKTWINLSDKLNALRNTLGEAIFISTWWEHPVINNKVYFFLAYDTIMPTQLTYHPRVFEFDLSTETFIEKGNTPFVFDGEGPRFAIGDTIYQVVLQNENEDMDSLLYAYYPHTDQWVLKGKLPYFGGLSTTFSLNHKGYYGMGFTTHQRKANPAACCSTTDFYEYDPVTNVWTKKADYPDTLVWDEGIGFDLDGKAYMGLGDNNPQLSRPGDPCPGSWLNNGSFYEYVPSELVSVKEEAQISQLMVLPNPFSQTIELTNLPHDIKDARMSIYNTMGVEVWKLDYAQQKINLEYFPSGLYYLVIRSGDQVYMARLNKR